LRFFYEKSLRIVSHRKINIAIKFHNFIILLKFYFLKIRYYCIYLKISLIIKYIPHLHQMARTQVKTAPVVATTTPVPTAAPVAEKAARSAPIKKAAVSAAPAVVSASIVVVPNPTIVEESTESSRESRYKSVLASIDAQVATLKELRSLAVSNFKTDSVELKLAQKSSGRRRRHAPVVSENGEPAPKKAPSGITKPTVVSDAMCAFMGKPPGTLIARTEVTKFVTSYIKDHNLKDENAKRHINPDNKLRALLSLPAGDQLTYFNLQTYMKSHFPPKVVKA
jgi:chromatin remodeling complex protein RSC6